MLTPKERLSKFLRRLKLRLGGTKGPATPAFVFGEMRSGTNMIIRTLAKSPNTEVYYEHDDEAFVDYRLRDEDHIRRLIARSPAKVVVFKPIADSQHANTILDTHESSLGIWIFRRYEDAVSSALVRWQEHKKYLDYVLHDPETANWRREGLTDEKLELVKHYYEKDVSDATARALIWYLRNSLYFDQQIENDDRVLLINYEKVTGAPKEAFERITSFLGCAYDDEMVSDIHSKSVGKKFESDIDDSVRKLCDDLFDELLKVESEKSKAEAPESLAS